MCLAMRLLSWSQIGRLHDTLHRGGSASPTPVSSRSGICRVSNFHLDSAICIRAAEASLVLELILTGGSGNHNADFAFDMLPLSTLAA